MQATVFSAPNKSLTDLALEAGFSQAYLLPMPVYPQWAALKQQGRIPPQASYIEDSPQTAHPWARGLLLLLWPYRPYKPDIPLSGYYPASQASYEAMLQLKQQLLALKVPVETARVPFKLIAEENGIGRRLRNGLLYVPPYGTRFLMQGLLVEQLGDKPKLPPVPPPPCASCRRCEQVCPGRAIREEGYHYESCIRLQMEETMPPFVMEKMHTLLGCELCQNVCPLNASIPFKELSEAEAYAFDPARLLQGQQKEALAIIGKNMKKGNKLIAQTAVLAAKNKRLDLLPLIEQRLAQATHPGERQALRWAVEYLKAQE